MIKGPGSTPTFCHRMRPDRLPLMGGILFLVLTHAWCSLQDSPPIPPTYAGISDQNIRAKPPLPHLGPAGFQFQDPTFGSRILRVTDAHTMRSGRNFPQPFFTTPLYGELNAWNSDGTLFYVESPGDL